MHKGIKIGALKCSLFAFSSTSAEYLQKFEFLIFRGSVATCRRWGGQCRMRFLANFVRFPAVQNFENRLRFDKVTKSYKVGTSFWDTVYISS